MDTLNELKDLLDRAEEELGVEVSDATSVGELLDLVEQAEMAQRPDGASEREWRFQIVKAVDGEMAEATDQVKSQFVAQVMQAIKANRIPTRVMRKVRAIDELNEQAVRTVGGQSDQVWNASSDDGVVIVTCAKRRGPMEMPRTLLEAVEAAFLE